MRRLTLVVPVYNEAPTIEAALRRLGQVEFPVPLEVIVVDDGSTDGTLDLVHRDLLPNAECVLTVRSRVNRGKGTAIRHGFGLATGDLIGVQDADLEYDPSEIPAVIRPILDGRTQVSLGARTFGAHASYSFWYVVGNRLMSLAAGALYDRWITDAYTCYKFFTREVLDELELTCDGFEIEAEIVAECCRRGYRIYEVPISYAARGRAEGKKIRPRDGVRGLMTLGRVRFRRAGR